MKLPANKRKVRIIIMILLILISTLALLYPTVSTAWNHYRSSLLIREYIAVLDSVAEEKHAQNAEAAKNYNEMHKYNHITDAFEDTESELADEYLQLLNPLDNGMMGYIEIPKINQKLIIYHGTSAEVLEKGVGHLNGTSLPIGGDSTHCVLAAHRGLPNARLFTDLDQLENGDKFFLYVSGETLEYEIDSVLIVSPYAVETLRIEQNKELVTLLTCTPYGANTQRLLVRGSRVPFYEEDVQTEKKKHRVIKTLDISAKAWCGEMLILLLMLIICCLQKLKRRKRGEENSDSKTNSSTS